jgi:hypothetical protein
LKRSKISKLCKNAENRAKVLAILLENEMNSNVWVQQQRHYWSHRKKLAFSRLGPCIQKPVVTYYIRILDGLEMKRLVFLMAIWNILPSFVIFYSHLVILWQFGIFFPVLVCCAMKILVTLQKSSVSKFVCRSAKCFF